MKKAIRYTWLTALLLCPIVLWILPVDYFTDGGPIVCPSRAFFDIECFGCGITRAVMNFHHFEFAEAIFYNSLVIAVYPFLVWLWQYWVRAELRHLGIWPKPVRELS